MKRNNKALVTVIIIGVAFVVIGAAILGVGMLRRNLSSAIIQDGVVIEPAKNPVSSDESLPELQSVKLLLGAVQVNIVASDHNELVSEGFEQGELTVRHDEKTGTLAVEQRDYDRYFRVSLGNYKITRVLTIYLDAQTLESFNLVLGAGDLTVDGMSAQTAEIKVGAGEVKFTNSAFSEIGLTLGAGDLNCSECDFSNFDLSGGAGSVKYTGTLGGWCELKNGVGEMTVRLTDSADNYLFRCTQGIGDISINGNNSFGLGVASNSYGSSDAPTTVLIRSGVGSVNIDVSA